MSIQSAAAEAEIQMREDFQQDIGNVATGLRMLADRLTDIAVELSAPTVPGPYASYAARVQHEVLWGLANLAVDRLTREAANLELTRTMAQGKTPGTTLDVEHPFTPRELMVARLIAHGTPDKEIARSLFISPRTVHAHVMNIYTKVEGVNSRTQLSAYMHRNALLEEKD